MARDDVPPLTDNARKAVALANQEAQRRGHEQLGVDHLLLGLLMGAFPEVIRALEIRRDGRDRIQAAIEERHPPEERFLMGPLPFTPESAAAIQRASALAGQLGVARIDVEHLLLAVGEDDGVAALLDGCVRGLSEHIRGLRRQLGGQAASAGNASSAKARDLSPESRTVMEMRLVGSLLLDPSVLSEVQEVLGTAETIRHPGCRVLYELITELQKEGHATDVIALGPSLNSSSGLAEAGGVSFVARVIGAVPDAGRTLQYASLIAKTPDTRK